MNIYAETNKTKIKLMRYAELNGVYENFGQKELRKLKDKYLDISDYSEEMNFIRKGLEEFDTWASHFNNNN